MRLKNVTLLIAFVALAALIGLTVRSMLSSPTAPASTENVRQEPRKEKPKVWVAKDNLEVGTFVDSSDLTAIEWPERARQPNFLVTTAVRGEEITGAVIRERIIKGAPILAEKIVRPGERGFLSAVLLPGMRAITIGIDNVTGHAGLVLPGDRVDLILTQTIEDPESDAISHASETIAKAMRVLAVGSRLSTATEQDDIDDRVRSVTLEATPRQVEAIAVVNSFGSLSLSVRSLPATESDAIEDQLASEEADLTKPNGPTFSYEVSTALNKGKRSSVQVMRGNSTRNQGR